MLLGVPVLADSPRSDVEDGTSQGWSMPPACGALYRGPSRAGLFSPAMDSETKSHDAAGSSRILDTDAPGGAHAYESPDLGFGRLARHGRNPRLLNRDGRFNVDRQGVPFIERVHLYRWMLGITWPQFFGIGLLAYLISNALFAFAFLACGPNALVWSSDSGLSRGFLAAFFFSVETTATIGYGNVAPGNTAANLLMVFDSYVSLISVALLTGLVFARFSQPRARIRLSERALVAPFGDGKALMVRLVNERDAPLVDVRAEISYVRIEDDGTSARRVFDRLPLQYDHIALFPLSWTLVHRIDDGSPLWGQTKASFADAEPEILVVVSATEEIANQGVHARSSYRASEVSFDERFAPMFEPIDDGQRIRLYVDRLSDTVPVDRRHATD